MNRNGKAEPRIIRGASNRILEVDLSAGTVEIFTVPDYDRLLYLGGKGLGLKLLYDRMEPGADPLGPGNMMAVMPGIMTGRARPIRGKFAAASKSPLTGIFTTSSCGGPFGMALKTSGSDRTFTQGQSLLARLPGHRSSGLRFLPADRLCGLDTARTQEELRPFGTGALVTGPAGENLVPYACAVSGHRVLGRGG